MRTNGLPVSCRSITPKTAEEKRRHAEAIERRHERLRLAGKVTREPAVDRGQPRSRKRRSSSTRA